MEFRATATMEDGRLTADRIYYGNLVWRDDKTHGLRVAVFDNKSKWMTFDPNVFVPVGLQYREG